VNGVVRLPVPAFARTDTSATDRSKLESISSPTEVASHPSDGSCELLSAPSDDEPETPEPTEAGDVAVLDVAGGERLLLSRKTEINKKIKRKTSSEGSPPTVPALPRTMAQAGTLPMLSPPEDTEDAAQPAPARACRRTSGGPASCG
jgi:hypothetical protein